MIHFIYGNPGTGKTEMIYSEIQKDAINKQSSILIVPEQFTVSAERDLIKKIAPSAQLYVEVLNFTRLANRLFREHGGISYNFISKAHEKLLMWRAIKSAVPFLREYQILSADDFSLADSMLVTYKELSASGITFEQIDEIANNCNNVILSSKMKDISLICSIYSSMINEKFTDTNSELSRLLQLLQSKRCLDGVNVYIDGFTSFTGVEHSIIHEIMRQADSVYITLAIPSPSYNGIDTLSIKECSDKLRRDCASIGVKAKSVLLDTDYRTNSEVLRTLSSDIWQMERTDTNIQEEQFDNSVELFRAADIYDECEFAAARIRELIEHGYRYKDIAIIARNIDKYRGIIEPALDNMGLKYYISEKSDLSSSPIAKFILSAIKTINRGWKRDDVISHLKSGLCNISAHDADIFEYYTAKWNISGKLLLTDEPWNMNPDGYTTIWSERGMNVIEIANKVKNQLMGNLKEYTSKLKSAQNYKEMCSATVDYLDKLNVRNSMLTLAKAYLDDGKVRDASDCIRMLEVALDSLDCICEVFSEETEPNINTFATALRIAFDSSELGTIPTSQDEIQLGSAHMLRTDNVKCAVILGVCDGEFPSSVDNSGLLNMRDKQYLIEHGVQISGRQEIISSDELYYFRRAVSAPSQKLIVFTRSDSEPSVAFTRILNLLPYIKVDDTSSRLLTHLRSLKAVSEYASLLTDTDEGYALQMLLNDFEIPHIDNNNVSVTAENDVIESDTIQAVIGREIALSQSKAELFTNCKFAYSCKYHLKLDDGKRAEFSFNNIGTFIHHILEKFIYQIYIVNKGIIPDYSEISNIVEDIIERYISELLPDNKNKSARLLHLIARLKNISISIIIELLNELSDSSFKPTFFELRIGSKDIPAVTLSLKNGSKISLTGIIDRVDVFMKDEKAYIRVVDYKTGNKTFSISDIQEGLNLQMLLYIFSLTQGNKEQLTQFFGGTPIAAGITYFSVDSSKRTEKTFVNIDGNSPNFAEIKRSGLILNNEDVIEAMTHSGNDKILMRTPRKNSFIEESTLSLLYDEVCQVLGRIGEEMVSGNINAHPSKGADSCKYCVFSSVCRVSHKGKG